MSGVVMKLGMMAVPNPAQKWVWVSCNIPKPNSLSLSLSLNTGVRREKHKLASAIYRRDGNLNLLRCRRRLTPCAPPAHDSHPPPAPLGFPFPPPPPPPPPPSASSAKHHHHHLHISSSEDRGALSDDMGSENNKGQDLNGKDTNHDLKQPVSSKFLTLPTVLTLGRVAAVPLLISTFYMDSWWGTTATTSIFIAAAITDWLDGYLARKMRLGSAFGAFLDPVADKLMVAATLVLLCTRPFDVPGFGQVPWLLTVPAIAIIGREITMSAVREWAASQNAKLLEAVAVNNLGKWKTATQMTALTILLATRDTSLGAPAILVASGVALLYISAGLAVWSLVVYMSKIWRVLLR